jgi:hypothetical protein
MATKKTAKTPVKAPKAVAGKDELNREALDKVAGGRKAGGTQQDYGG